MSQCTATSKRVSEAAAMFLAYVFGYQLAGWKPTPLLTKYMRLPINDCFSHLNLLDPFRQCGGAFRGPKHEYSSGRQSCAQLL